MYKHFNQLASGVFAFLLLLFFSCTQEEALLRVDNADVYLTLNLNIPGRREAATRALTTGQETVINNLTVLVFKESAGATGDNATYAYTAPIASLTSGSVTVRLLQSTTGEKYSLLMLAGAGTPERTPTTADTRAVVKRLYIFTAPATRTELPMCGESSAQVINESTSFGTISLKRAVARVDVGLDFDVTTNGAETVKGLKYAAGHPHAGNDYFRLDEVTVYRANQKGYVADAGIPTTTLLASSYAVTGNLTVRDIYLTERKNTTDASGNIALPQGQRVCLVLKGTYDTDGDGELTDETASYYRVDFVDAAGKQMDLVRNNLYRVNVTKISGNGFATAGEADAAGPVNITVSIEGWGDADLPNIDFDGQSYFRSGAKSVTLLNEVDATQTLSVESNVPSDEWTFANQAAWTEALTVEKTNTTLVFTSKTTTAASHSVQLKIRNLTVTFSVQLLTPESNLSPGGVVISGWGSPVYGSTLPFSLSSLPMTAEPGSPDDEGAWLDGGELDAGTIVEE